MNLGQVRINHILIFISQFKNYIDEVSIKYEFVYSIYLNLNVISNKNRYLEVIN